MSTQFKNKSESKEQTRPKDVLVEHMSHENASMCNVKHCQTGMNVNKCLFHLEVYYQTRDVRWLPTMVLPTKVNKEDQTRNVDTSNVGHYSQFPFPKKSGDRHWRDMYTSCK